MNLKHTPGPWAVTEGSDWCSMSGVSLGIDDAFGQDGGRDYHLATVVHGDPDELLANARLIAAAPDMLAALEALESWSSQDISYAKTHPVAMARAAIAKATGGAA